MLLSAPAQGKDSSPIHGSSTRRGRHRCGHDGQRKCVAHMPTAATTTEDSRSKFGRKLPTRLHDEALKNYRAVAVMPRQNCRLQQDIEMEDHAMSLIPNGYAVST